MSFHDCQRIELQALSDLLPFLHQRYEGRFVTTYKGSLSKTLQMTVGDIVANRPVHGDVIGIELKSEEEDRYGNFFLEMFSNFSWERRKPGWMQTLASDALFYYFIREKSLYVIPFRRLYEWGMGRVVVENGKPVFYPGAMLDGRYRHKPGWKVQAKHEQMNKTIGIPVPIEDVRREVGLKKFLLDGDIAIDVTEQELVVSQNSLFPI